MYITDKTSLEVLMQNPFLHLTYKLRAVVTNLNPWIIGVSAILLGPMDQKVGRVNSKMIKRTHYQS